MFFFLFSFKKKKKKVDAGIFNNQKCMFSFYFNILFTGLPLLEQLHLISAGRINLMPGSGVNKSNVEHILPTLPGVTDVHLSGKQSIQPNFKQETEVSKGDSRDVTNTAVIREVRDIINGLEKKLRGENM